MLRPDHVCAGLPHLRTLTFEELTAALVALRPTARAECLGAIGLRARASDPPDRLARLVAARLRTTDGSGAHNVGVLLTSDAREATLAAIGDDEATLADDIARGLAGPLATWPVALLATMFALLGELGAISEQRVGEVIAVLGASSPAGPTTASTGGVATGEAAPGVRTSGHVEAAADEASGGLSDLDALLAEAVVRADAGGHGAEVATSLRAVESLLLLDGTRPGTWRLLGFADCLAGAPARRLPTFVADQRYRVGGIAALVHRGELRAVAARLSASPELGTELLQNPEDAELVEPVLAAMLEHDPAIARRMLQVLPGPFPGWHKTVERLRHVAAEMADTDATAGMTLLRAGDDLLTDWTANASDDMLTMLERAAAELAVDRAACQRRVGDFVGARALVSRIDPQVLPTQTRMRLVDETALVAARLRCLPADGFRLIGARRETARLQLDRAGAEIEAAVESGEGLVGRVLRAMGSAASGRANESVVDLRMACALLADTHVAHDLGALAAALEFNLGLQELDMLEPRLVVEALGHIDSAIAAGYEPDSDELYHAAVVLDAHGSAAATRMLSRSLSSEPHRVEALGLLCGLARGAVDEPAGEATELAETCGGDERLPRRLRFELIDAALTGAEARHDFPVVERLADSLERLVARAADADLDRRWDGRLATDDSLRSTMGGDTVDLVRLDVLRRVGEVAGAAAVARGLFHRSVAGHVDGVDPADLLELLDQLGVDDAEVQSLARLLPSVDQPMAAVGPPPAVAGAPSTLVLFVGGNETQQRAWPAIERDLHDKFGDAVEVEHFATGWGANWAPAAERIEARYPDAHAVVVMTFVRTMLGRRIRRSAGESGLPWIACTGHGRASIVRAVERAVTISAAQARAASKTAAASHSTTRSEAADPAG